MSDPTVPTLERMTAAQIRALAPNPLQWRTHPAAQMAALEAQMRRMIDLDDGDTSGHWGGALLFNERTGHMIDGHGRQGLPDDLLEGGLVLRVRWTEEQERLMLRTFDPIGQMSGEDPVMLAALMATLADEEGEMAEALAAMGEDEEIEPEPPESFPEVDESLPTEHQCPSCGYKGSGNWSA